MKKLLVVGIILLFLGRSILTLAHPEIVPSQSQRLNTKATLRGYGIDLNGTLGNNGWFVSDVTITITGLHGNESIWYEFNNGSYVPYTSPVQFIVRADGNYSFAVIIIDPYGNQTQLGPVFFKIDQIPPMCYAYKEVISLHKIKFIAIVQDNTSLLDRVEFRNGSNVLFTQYFTYPNNSGQQVASWILNPVPKDTTVYVFAYDLAGNVAGMPAVFSLSLQKPLTFNLNQQGNKRQSWTQPSTIDTVTFSHIPANGMYWNGRKIADYPVPLAIRAKGGFVAGVGCNVTGTNISRVEVWVSTWDGKYLDGNLTSPPFQWYIAPGPHISVFSHSPTYSTKVYMDDGQIIWDNLTIYRLF
jgi:hypothetical protein